MSKPPHPNVRAMVDRLAEIKNQEETIRQGGGPKAIDKRIG